MTDDPNQPQDPPELTLETVIETPIEELKDDQKTFIQEHAEELSDEQRETYKEILETKDEEEEEINPDKIEPETRGGKPISKKKEKEEPEEESEEEEEEEINPEDEKTIGKVVDRKLKDVTETLKEVQSIKDQTEVDSFIRVRPELGKYRDVALKYMAHPAYANIPVGNIMAIVSSKDQQKLGAQKEREIQKKVNDTRQPGNPAREPGRGKFDWKNASPEDVEAQRAKVLGRPS